MFSRGVRLRALLSRADSDWIARRKRLGECLIKQPIQVVPIDRLRWGLPRDRI